MKINWQELETSGFLVIPSFLTAEEISILRTEYDSLSFSGNVHYNYKVLSYKIIDEFQSKLEGIASQIRANTNVKVDLTVEAYCWATENGINFNWHQDNETFYIFQNHYDYVNFYIPLQKPDATKSGISIVPWDVLKTHAPELAAQRVRSGACRARIANGKTVFFDDNNGDVKILPFDLSKIAVSPVIGPGDLLLLRGDLIHKTQDADTMKIAVSFRMVNSKGIVSKTKYEQTCLNKSLALRNHRELHEARLSCFARAGKEEMTIAEYERIFRAIGASPQSPDTPAKESSLDDAFLLDLARLARNAQSAKVIVIDKAIDTSGLAAARRVAAMFGVLAVVVNTAKLIGMSTLSAAYGTYESASLAPADDINKVYEMLRSSGYQIVVLRQNGGKPLFECNLSGPIAIVVGGDALIPATSIPVKISLPTASGSKDFTASDLTEGGLGELDALPIILSAAFQSSLKKSA